MSEPELKPCPFCGSEASFGIVTEGGEANPDFGGHFVQCSDTSCHGCMGLRFACGDDPRPALRDAWNQRVTDASLTEATRLLDRLVQITPHRTLDPSAPLYCQMVDFISKTQRANRPSQ